MFTFDGWVTRVAFELHWALETRLHATALNSELCGSKYFNSFYPAARHTQILSSG